MEAPRCRQLPAVSFFPLLLAACHSGPLLYSTTLQLRQPQPVSRPPRQLSQVGLAGEARCPNRPFKSPCQHYRQAMEQKDSCDLLQLTLSQSLSEETDRALCVQGLEPLISLILPEIA